MLADGFDGDLGLRRRRDPLRLSVRMGGCGRVRCVGAVGDASRAVGDASRAAGAAGVAVVHLEP